MTTPSHVSSQCTLCGAPLAGAALPGCCPACLWQELTAEAASAGGSENAAALFTVPGHDVLAEIARGGGGIVYRAQQYEPRREVALKMLLPHQTTSEEMHTRFRVETSAIAALEHRAILPVYVVGEHRGMPFFTMKLALGGTLASRRDALRGDWRAIAALIATLADAVHFAHARGVIHRDLKPGNVLFDEADQPYVSDFGLAKFLTTDADVTRTMASLGTPAYLAPEIALHGAAAATIATDVYGLGAILYELLAGRAPFVNESIPALLREVAEHMPPPLRRFEGTVPRDLEVIAMRCLAKDPARRLDSAGELAADLRRWLENRPVHARPVAAGERFWLWVRRNPALAATSVLLVGSVVAGGAMLLDRNADLERASQRALGAEREARERLQEALINEARVTRRTGLVGQRASALARLDQAVGIGPHPRLRSEYIATLVQHDLAMDERVSAANARSDYTVDFSRDLTRFLSADAPGGFLEREVATGRVTREFRTVDPVAEVWYLAYARDDDGVLVSYRDGRTEFWRRDGAAPVWIGAGIYGRDTQPRPIAVHPTGAQLARVAADDSIYAIELATGAKQVAIPAAGEVRVLSFDPEGRVVVVVHRDRAAAWSWPEAKLLWSLSGALGPARPGWTADGRRVALGFAGQNITAVVDARTGRVERWIAAHGGDSRFLEFQPGGRLLASVGWDARLTVHDFLTGQRVLQREAWVRVLRFSADGQRLAFSVNHLEVATATFAPVDCLHEFGAEPVTESIGCRLTVSADGRWLASSDFFVTRLWDERDGRLVDVGTAPERPEPSSERDWSAVAFAPAGDAVIESRRFFGLLRRPLIVNDATGAPARFGPAELCAIEKPGDLLRIDPRSGDWWLQRFATGELLVCPAGAPERERRVLQTRGLDGPGLSPDGRLIARRCYPEPGVQILNARTATEVAKLPVGLTLSATFMPDGKRLLTGTGREYCLWDTETWEPGATWLARIEGGSYGGGYGSPDGRMLAVVQGRGTIELRSGDGETRLLELEPPQDIWVNHLAWSPDSARLYLLCQGHRVLSWDLPAIRRELAARGLDWME